MRRADGSGIFQIFFDGQMLVEGVVLGNVGYIFPEGFVVLVERALVEKHAALGWLELTRQSAQQCAFAAAAGPHHADHLAAFDREGDAVDGHRVVGEAANQIAHIECADDIFFLFDQAFREVAAEHLAGIDADCVAILEWAGIPHRHAAHNDRSVGLQDLHLADFAIVVAGDFQQHIAARAGGEKDVVLLQ